jgi:hypothetical protein
VGCQGVGDIVVGEAGRSMPAPGVTWHQGARRRASDHDRLDLVPQHLRAGDRFTESEGTEWELLEHPVVMLGRKHRANARRVDDRATTREMVWLSYGRMTVRRPHSRGP